MNKKNETIVISPIVREKLANYAHEAWVGWMEYLFAQSTQNGDGTVTIPTSLVDRWKWQIEKNYYEFPEEMKLSDRKEADRMIAIINNSNFIL